MTRSKCISYGYCDIKLSEYILLSADNVYINIAVADYPKYTGDESRSFRLMAHSSVTKFRLKFSKLCRCRFPYKNSRYDEGTLLSKH